MKLCEYVLVNIFNRIDSVFISTVKAKVLQIFMSYKHPI